MEVYREAVDAAVLDQPPQLDEAKIAEIEKLVNELNPTELVALHESIGPELERIQSMPEPESSIEEVGIDQVFTPEELADSRVVEEQRTEEEKKSSWWKTSLKVIGYGGLIAAGLYLGHSLGAGSKIWNALTKAGPALAEVAAKGAELATEGYEALAGGIESLSEGAQEVMKNMGILSDLGEGTAEMTQEGLRQAAEGLQGAEGLGGAAEGLLQNPPGIDDLKKVIPDSEIPPMPGQGNLN